MVQLAMTHPFPKKKVKKRPMTDLESFDYFRKLADLQVGNKWITVPTLVNMCCHGLDQLSRASVNPTER